MWCIYLAMCEFQGRFNQIAISSYGMDGYLHPTEIYGVSLMTDALFSDELQKKIFARAFCATINVFSVGTSMVVWYALTVFE